LQFCIPAVSTVFLGQLHQLGKFLHHVAVTPPPVGYQAIGAVLHAAVQIDEVAAAVTAQRIQRTVAEQTVEVLRMVGLVTRKELAGSVLGEGIVTFLRFFSVKVVHFTFLLYKY
jgi:hypothetical protein